MFFTIPVPFQEVPKYNEKRRATLVGTIGLHRSRSDPRLNVAGLHSKPPSPAPSNNSLPQCISNGNLFEASNAGILYRQNYDSDSPRSMSISDTGSCSGLSGELPNKYNKFVNCLPSKLKKETSPNFLFYIIIHI